MVSIGKTLRKKASGLLSPTTGQIPDHDDNMSGQRKQTQSLLDSYKELSQAVTGFQKVIDTLNRHHKVKISRSSDSNLNDFFATYDQALVSSRKAGLSTERTLKSIQQDLENSEAKLQLSESCSQAGRSIEQVPTKRSQIHPRHLSYAGIAEATVT
ncbi:MAG: hypothetical protein KVP17_000760 [Porospora cf. gigantea B]|uniref:uncharacterized protein n=1 Tax=Porospora cf. gigantea B TaxID=2853592 RepID=UPI00357184B4|nr:MAG: hypothetical protein KVP17_000760 [Porospora cf. gigantea B]